MKNEVVTKEKNYRGLLIQQVTQKSGRNTYDIKNIDGSPVEWALESWAIAQATIDAELDEKRGFYHE